MVRKTNMHKLWLNLFGLVIEYTTKIYLVAAHS